jgi:hypothetical protein
MNPINPNTPPSPKTSPELDHVHAEEKPAESIQYNPAPATTVVPARAEIYYYNTSLLDQIPHKSLTGIGGCGDSWTDEKVQYHCASKPESTADNMKKTKDDGKVMHAKTPKVRLFSHRMAEYLKPC